MANFTHYSIKLDKTLIIFILFFRNKSSTLSVESHFNYTALDVSPNGSVLLAINESEYCKFHISIQFSAMLLNA